MRARVAASTGVPVELLTGDTEEACTAQAQAALKFAKAKQPGYPDVRTASRILHPLRRITQRKLFAASEARAEVLPLFQLLTHKRG